MTGAELQEKREALGLSPREFAEALGVSRPFISMLESGTRRVRTLTEHAVWCLMYEAEVSTVADRLHGSLYEAKAATVAGRLRACPLDSGSEAPQALSTLQSQA